MKKAYKIEVDCANCAAKMEDAVKKVDGVNDAVISFMAQKLTVDFADDADIETVFKQICKACKKIESDVVIK